MPKLSLPPVNKKIGSSLDRQKPAGVRRHPQRLKEVKKLKIKRWVAWMCLFPLGTVTAFTLAEMFWRAVIRVEFWRSEPLVFFVTGGVVWWMAYLFRWRPLHSYVIGHEVSHMLMARVFGGKIYKWDHGPAGGYVETDKSNTWISLAPYIVPLYPLIVLCAHLATGLFFDTHEAVTVPAGVLAFSFKPAWLFYILLGFTWWFHATYTWKTVAMEQGDLRRNGEFFSMQLIFVANLAVLLVLFLASSSTPGLGLGEMGRCWLSTAAFLWRNSLGLFW
ncbi:MAG TPA: hypothetical protein DIT13_15745 [Verrucomicrobiales bacterium]|nr:hypothetical protein [Verrucomicrobiales bacterium]HRJ08915.1 hypothetical protein [Prosthecobacter sp.]HRK12832.1 hypothetical protein [Prosthecobacter sp.]